MRSLRQVMRGEHNCAYCREPATGWANENHVCKRHQQMERDVGGHSKTHRGHNAMPDATRRRMERRLG